MKRWISLAILMLVMMSVLAGCGGGGGGNETEPKKVSYKDGSFEGESDKDDRGAYGTITLVLKDSKITSADFEEILSDGKPKDETYQYQTSVEAQPVYEDQLVEKQDPDKVDSVSGATATWEKFKAATKAALAKAKE